MKAFMTIFVSILLVAFVGDLVFSQDKIRVFITDTGSWEMTGGFGASSSGSAAGAFTGGARPQTAEVIKTFRERCPSLTVTANRDKADFIVLLDHEGGKGYARKDNKVAVFKKDGDAIHSGSTRSLGNAVKDACAAIEEPPRTN